MTDTINVGTASLEAKKAWIEALESGAYEQVQGTLKGATESGVGFCCLGVWLELKGEQMETAYLDTPDGIYTEEGPQPLYDTTIRDLGDFQDTGITMNDRGDSFSDIAQAAREFYNL